jgi:beta-lactamase superfamily II metal-dependent hydrolase
LKVHDAVGFAGLAQARQSRLFYNYDMRSYQSTLTSFVYPRFARCVTSLLIVAVTTVACWRESANVANSGAAVARIVFLDVGQGDATLVFSPEGRVALIDAGSGDTDIVGQLRRHGVDTVDIAIATHPHADHIGGFAAVFDALPVRHYMDNGVPHTTQTYRDLLEVLSRSGVIYLESTRRPLQLGGVVLRVLPPLPDAPDLNSGSIGIVVEYGLFRALVTGDSDAEELSHFLQVGVPDVDVLKAPHHGARDAVTPAWLAATKPEVVVISCGRGNPYGHPDAWALRYYETVASQVFRTDVDGEVIIVVRGEGEYAVMTERVRTLAQQRD